MNKDKLKKRIKNLEIENKRFLKDYLDIRNDVNVLLSNINEPNTALKRLFKECYDGNGTIYIEKKE